ncbi:MAG: M28 family peptidase [Fibrobacteres bacterium]|nr:M28 family peptidase [Fibrobacterota bacterium]
MRIAAFFILVLVSSSLLAAKSDNYLKNPAARKAYLEKMLKELCTEIGPHSVFDTTAFRKVSDAVKREMKSSGLEVLSDEYSFKGWKLLEKPLFTTGGNAIPVAVCHGSCTPPPDGVRGTAQQVYFKEYNKTLYTLTDKNGNICLHLIPHGPPGTAAAPMPFTSAIPLVDSSVNEYPDVFEKESKVPVVMIGSADLPVLEKAVKEKTEVYCNFKTVYVPKMKSQSIAGTLRGKRRDEILLIGHLDTVYDSPGANDNTATVIMLMMLLFSRVNVSQDMTITVLATSGEEYGKLGAWSYLKRREREGTLKDIKFALNFDSMTWGDKQLLLNSTNEMLLEIVAESKKRLGYDVSIDNIRKDFYLDAAPFFNAGIPALYINTRGLPIEEIYRLYHHPADVPASVRPEFVEKWYLLFDQALNILQSNGSLK